MAKRKNRPYPRTVKRRCVESDPTTWFAFITFIVTATIALWVYIAIVIVNSYK